MHLLNVIKRHFSRDDELECIKRRTIINLRIFYPYVIHLYLNGETVYNGVHRHTELIVTSA